MSTSTTEISCLVALFAISFYKNFNGDSITAY